MISKGNQRAGGQHLATHLLNQIDNERVQVMDIRGSIANDLHGAMAEWQATATGTKCKKYLYSLSINPDPKQRPLSREEFQDFIARTEKSLGLENQPRAIVFHTKHGREHCHVAWSRIDTEKLKAVQLSHDRQKLRTVVQEFARDYGLELTQAMKKNRGKDRYEDRKKYKSLADRQQEERTGISKQDRQKEITEAWSQTTTGKAFIQALEKRGYIPAQGNKRAYVVIDRYGEVHSLSRQIDGARAKDVTTRLHDTPLESLPTAQNAQKHAKEKTQAALKEFFAIQKDPRRQKLEARHLKKRETLAKRKAALLERQKQQRQRLSERIRERNEQRAAEKTKLIKKLWAKMIGQKPQRAGLTSGQKKSIEAQKRRHKRQLKDISRRERSLKALQSREVRSLETKIKREGRQAARSAPTKEQKRLLEKFMQNAQDIAKGREAPKSTARDTQKIKPPEKESSLPFNQKAEDKKVEFSQEFIKALKTRKVQKKEPRDRGRGPTPT